MHIEDLQITLALIDSIHRTDDKDIQDKLKQIVSIRLDAILAEGK
jgi:hypothetical protein